MLPDSPDASATQLAAILELAARGDRSAFDDAFALLYRELAVLAKAQRHRLPGNATLNTTALVHEAYLKLVGGETTSSGEDRGPRWQSRQHFFAIAAKAMRHVLVNYAERRRAAKRGGGTPHTALDEASVMAPETAEEVIALDEALAKLAALDQRQARVVECRFFAGLSVEETAEALAISPATVKRDWQTASAWLHRELRGTAPQPRRADDSTVH